MYAGPKIRVLELIGASQTAFGRLHSELVQPKQVSKIYPLHCATTRIEPPEVSKAGHGGREWDACGNKWHIRLQPTKGHLQPRTYILAVRVQHMSRRALALSKSDINRVKHSFQLFRNKSYFQTGKHSYECRMVRKGDGTIETQADFSKSDSSVFKMCVPRDVEDPYSILLLNF